MVGKLLQRRKLYWLVLVVSLAGMLGSLYYSDIVGLVPCTLCWYQRILLYPIVFLSIVGLYRRDAFLPYYVLPLSLSGMLVSGYHYSIQMFVPAAVDFVKCTSATPCAALDLVYAGFITIPLMSFTAFGVISLAMYFSRKSSA